MRKTSKANNYFLFFVKLCVTIGILLFIYFKLKDQDYELVTLTKRLKETISNHTALIAVVILLMPLNWSIESLKWQALAGKVSQISFISAFQGVLTGISLSFITPHGLGDYLGRIMTLHIKDRGRLTGAILIGRLCQMSVTVILGLLGASQVISPKWLLGLIFILIVSALLLMTFGKKVGWFLNKLPGSIRYYLTVIANYNSRDVIHIFILSLCRYLTFSIQLIILLIIFNPELSWWDSLCGTTWVFLAKSVIPTFNFLSDLGVREFSAIYYFENMPLELSSIILATLLLWVINILIPTLIGTPLVMKMKIASN